MPVAARALSQPVDAPVETRSRELMRNVPPANAQLGEPLLSIDGCDDAINDSAHSLRPNDRAECGRQAHFAGRSLRHDLTAIEQNDVRSEPQHSRRTDGSRRSLESRA